MLTWVVTLPAVLGAVSSSFEGTIHTGVGSEQEARSFPCAPPDTGDAARSGPVVCVPAQEGSWTIESGASGECQEEPTGWRGACIFVLDLGHELRVWGTRGIPPTVFRITWSSDEPSPSPTPADVDPDGGGVDGSDNEGGEVPPPRVAAPEREPSEPPVAGTSAFDVAPEASTTAAGGSRGIPEAAFWDPPVSEVPGYSDLTVGQPTFTPAGDERRDAGAPVAAGVLALVAGGYAIADRRWLRGGHRTASQ